MTKINSNITIKNQPTKVQSIKKGAKIGAGIGMMASAIKAFKCRDIGADIFECTAQEVGRNRAIKYTIASVALGIFILTGLTTSISILISSCIHKHNAKKAQKSEFQNSNNKNNKQQSIKGSEKLISDSAAKFLEEKIKNAPNMTLEDLDRMIEKNKS